MKKNNQAITHDSFPQFVAKLESASVQLAGRKISRGLASFINTLTSCTIIMLIISILSQSIEPEKLNVPEAVSHIPAFFQKASSWALGLFPEDMSIWICLLILLAAIPVSGVVTGLIFRFIPFKGKALTVDPADSTTQYIDNAIALTAKLKALRDQVTDCFTANLYVTPILTGLGILALPIISVCRACSEHAVDSILIAILYMIIGMFLILAGLLCVLCFLSFWLCLFQEQATCLFYSGNNYTQESQLLSDYRKLLEQESADAHNAQVAQTEAAAIEHLIAGRVAAALKTLDTIKGEAKDEYYIKVMAQTMIECNADNPDWTSWADWLDWKEDRLNSAPLQEFLRQQQAISRQKLLELAEETYPTALELLEKGKYEKAYELLSVANTIDYRDGVALYAYADYKGNRANSYRWIIEKLTHGINKGMDSEKWEAVCLIAINQAKEIEALEKEFEAAAAEAKRREEEAYWLNVGREINMSCPHLVNGYCCRYCTLDNFPHKCYYLDRPRDMWMCTDRK